MHELALMQELATLIAEAQAREGFSRVRRVTLAVGALSCAEPSALRFAFPSAMLGTCAEGAELDIVLRPARAWCWQCLAETEIARRGGPCPRCGSEDLAVRAGDELKVEALEVV